MTNKKDMFKLENVWTSVKDAVKDTNKFALNVTDDLVVGALKNGAEWQKIASKATKGSLELTARQQDITFETVADLKKQFNTGFKRLKKIFS